MHKMWNRKESHVSASQCSVTIPPLWDKETEWAKVSLFRWETLLLAGLDEKSVKVWNTINEWLWKYV